MVVQLERSINAITTQNQTRIAPQTGTFYRSSSYTFDHMQLRQGGSLAPVTLAYETWGRLNATKTNAILITHALTGNAHAHDAQNPTNTKIAWWNPLIGPGKPIDTNRYFVICSNVIGSCYGSTGPTSRNPLTDRPYGMRFPVITIHDMVQAQHRLILNHFGIQKLAAVIGGSIGGQQALEWAVTFPEMVEKVAVIAATAALTAQGIAFNEVARQSIMADPNWQCGDYAPGREPDSGLAIARMLAMITYQSEESMELRFSRKPARNYDSPSPTHSPNLGGRFDVESYLYHQGDALTHRFDANSYLYLSRAMDLYDVSEGYGSIEEALQRIHGQALFVGISSDLLFPAAHVRWLAKKVNEVGSNATYMEIDSPNGHDAFLKDWDHLASVLHLFTNNDRSLS